MVNQEILGGLRFALNKGEPLEKATTSFYNAGYRKEEIEEAAMFLKQERIVPTKKTELIPAQNLKSLPKISSYDQKKLEKSTNPVKKITNGFVIAIIIAAIVFVGLLITFLLTT